MSPSRPSRLVALAAIVSACGQLILAQQEPIPTFRTGIEAVQLDVFVTDADGNPVTGLTVDDFELFEAGIPQAITTFSAVHLPIERALGRAAAWDVQPDVRGNGGPEGRIYVFALDEVTPVNALRTRAFLRRFLEDHFQPADVAAVVLTGRGLASTGQDFTSSPHLLLGAIDRFSGGFGDPCTGGGQYGVSGPGRALMPLPRGQEDDFFVRSRMTTLRQLIDVMARMPGGRKSLVYVSECVGFNMFDIRDYGGGTLSIVGTDAHAAMAAATRGNVAVYPVDPAGLAGGSDIEARADLSALAQVTGGFALSDSNNYTRAFERIVQENSTYYVLGFNSSYTRRDGRFVRVDVRVRRPGLQVRSRDGYVAPLGGRPAAEAAPPPAIAAMANPFATRGVGMEVFAAAYKGTGRDPAVALALEFDIRSLDLVDEDGTFSGMLDITYVATDDRGRVYPGARHTYALRLPPALRDHLLANGLRVVSQLALPPGRYQLRVGAAQGTRSGSVVHDVEVPDFTRGDLAMSGLALTSDRAAATVTVRPAPAGDRARVRGARCQPPSCTVTLAPGAPSDDDPLRGGLPGAATTRREFTQDDTLVVFAEVYTNARRTRAAPMAVRTELQGEDGRVWATSTERQVPATERRASGGYGVLAELPLRDLPPGRYLLRVDAQSDATSNATASRAVPMAVTAIGR